MDLAAGILRRDDSLFIDKLFANDGTLGTSGVLDDNVESTEGNRYLLSYRQRAPGCLSSYGTL